MKHLYSILLLLSLNAGRTAYCQGVTAGDCDDAVSICTNHSFSITPSGFGSVDELCTSCFSNPSTNPASSNSGCLLSGELHSTWFLVNVLTAGELEFSFGAPGGSNCYDWAMWVYSPSACGDIASNSLAPIRCNWNATCQEFTGMADIPLPTGGDPGDFEPPLTVGSNTQYLICFSNYSSTTTSVPLNFFGTAGISCTPLGNFSIDLNGSSETGKNIINWYVENESGGGGYTIERRGEDGLFTSIGSITASVEEGNLKRYMFTDEAPQNGVNYYQVTQIRLDGSKIHSGIIGIEQQFSGLSVLNAYPNPANHSVHLKISSQTAQVASLFVVDVVGTTVYSGVLQLQEGVSLSSLTIEDYESGTYLLFIRDEAQDEVEVVRFTKY